MESTENFCEVSISSGLKKSIHNSFYDSQVSFKNEDPSNEYINSYIDEAILKTDWNIKVTAVDAGKCLLTSEMKGVFGMYAESVQALIFKGVAIHNDYLVGLPYKTAMIDAFHTSDIINFKDESYKLALEIAKWRAGRHQVRNRAESFRHLLTSTVEMFSTVFIDKNIGLKFILDGFLYCLTKEYFSLTTFQDIPFLSNKIKFDYPVSNNTLNKLNFYDATFGLMQYALRGFSEKLFPNELLKTEFLSDSRKFDLLYDIAEMMPYFIKNWDASKHKLYEGGSIRAYLDLGISIPEIKFVYPSATDSFIRHSSLGLSWYPATGKCSWISGEWIKNDLKEHLEAFFLPKMHQHLLELFSNVNMKVKKRINTEDNEELPFIEYAIHSHLLKDIENKNNELDEGNFSENNVSGSILIIPHLRYSRFKIFMEEQFNCKFTSGKGSEIKVQKQGSKIYTLGHHKKDPLIPTWLIKNILRRMDIDNSEFALKLDAL